MGNVWNIIKNFCMEEDGISTVEVILILVDIFIKYKNVYDVFYLKD